MSDDEVDAEIAAGVREVGWYLACLGLQESARELREHLESLVGELPNLVLKLPPDEAGVLIAHVRSAQHACRVIEDLPLQ